MNEEETVQAEEVVAPETPREEDNFKDKYFRLLAETENMRKRMQKEKQDMIRFGIENAIAEFLSTIDNFENALRFADQATGEVKNWAIGFQMILSQFKEVLHNHGITAFHSEGNTFDPAYHEAVEIVETKEYPEGVVLQEFTKGYKSPTRTIRPARVKVAKLPMESLPSVEQEETFEEK